MTWRLSRDLIDDMRRLDDPATATHVLDDAGLRTLYSYPDDLTRPW
ncbi:MAG: hypothetical protein GXY65_11105, partial [Rhodococcus sp.]|nr:hypothetical protein [Rhodococcus sp. (in: high G+C Gram-positive bacteria)]